MTENNMTRYEVSIYYTHIKSNLITHQVKKFSTAYDTVEAALKRARRLADKKKGVYITTVIDTQTGEIIYQKTEINNMGSGMWMYEKASQEGEQQC